MVIYLETSAFISYLLKEPGSEKVVSLIDGADTIATASLTFVETRRSLLRLERDKALLSSELQRVSGILAQLALKWNVKEFTAEIQKRAGDSFPVEPVRTLDGIHLASALELLKVFPDLAVLSFDKRILDNLEPLGLVRADLKKPEAGSEKV